MSYQAMLTTADAAALRKFTESVSDKRTYIRALAVCLLAEGATTNAVCTQLSVDRRALYRWLHWFLERRDPADLGDKPRSGRPSISASISDEQILIGLDKDPRIFGYAYTTWTVAVLADHLARQFKVHFSNSTLRRRMKAMGLRYKLPRYVYEEKEPNRAQKKGRSSVSSASGLRER